jgi:hypothetical protein
MIAGMALWVGGVLRVRPARLGVPAAGAAVVVTLLAVHGWSGTPAPSWVPATVLVVLLTTPSRRSIRSEQALFRARGATGGQVIGLASAEAAVAGLAGGLLGVGMSLAGGFLPEPGLLLTREIVLLLLAGPIVAALGVVPPVVREWYCEPRDDGPPWWSRYGFDFVLLALAFLWPILGWAGGIMMVWRLVELGLHKGKRAIGGLLRPLVSGLSGVLALSISWRSALLARSVVLVALAVAFAISSAFTRGNVPGAAVVDLTVALVLAAAAAGPSFGLALNERRRDLLIVSTLGGKRRQVAAFIAGDALIVAGGGLIAGHLLGVLFIVFGPMRAGAFPRGYFGVLALVVIASCVAASARIAQLAARDEVSDLRDY